MIEVGRIKTFGPPFSHISDSFSSSHPPVCLSTVILFLFHSSLYHSPCHLLTNSVPSQSIYVTKWSRSNEFEQDKTKENEIKEEKKIMSYVFINRCICASVISEFNFHVTTFLVVLDSQISGRDMF